MLGLISSQLDFCRAVNNGPDEPFLVLSTKDPILKSLFQLYISLWKSPSAFQLINKQTCCANALSAALNESIVLFGHDTENLPHSHYLFKNYLKTVFEHITVTVNIVTEDAPPMPRARCSTYPQTKKQLHEVSTVTLSSHLTYPLTAMVFGHHRWFRNQFAPFFSTVTYLT